VQGAGPGCSAGWGGLRALAAADAAPGSGAPAEPRSRPSGAQMRAWQRPSRPPQKRPPARRPSPLQRPPSRQPATPATCRLPVLAVQLRLGQVEGLQLEDALLGVAVPPKGVLLPLQLNAAVVRASQAAAAEQPCDGRSGVGRAPCAWGAGPAGPRAGGGLASPGGTALGGGPPPVMTRGAARQARSSPAGPQPLSRAAAHGCSTAAAGGRR
jgi:hypothetical protein